jgi:Fe2+ or Zn2+ uptake regulation protein
MTESLKEKADRLFRANPPPTRAVSIEELQRSIVESKEKLQNREKSGKRKSNGEKEKMNTIGTVSPCPKCGVTNWNVFPDGRKYCCGCGAVMEIDGSVTGGANKKITQIESDEILVPFICKMCGKIVQFKAPNLEIAMKKTVPHKKYDPESKCEGTLIFLEQGIQGSAPVPISKTRKFENRIAEPEMVIDKKKCQNPKRDIFICNKCRDIDYCDQSDIDAIICLLINADMKLKRILERM